MGDNCGARLSACHCSKTVHHDGPHACTDASPFTASGRCHGQWHDSHHLVQYPTGAWTEEEALEHVALIKAGKPIPAAAAQEAS